jgi:hypothetical protein
MMHSGGLENRSFLALQPIHRKIMKYVLSTFFGEIGANIKNSEMKPHLQMDQTKVNFDQKQDKHL